MVRGENPPRSNGGLVEHSDFSASFLQFVVLKGVIDHETVMFFPLKQGLPAPGLVVVEPDLHVVPVPLDQVFIQLLVLFPLLYFLVAREYHNVVRVILLHTPFVIELDVLGHDWPRVVQTDEDGVPQV